MLFRSHRASTIIVFKILYPSVILVVNAWCRGSSRDAFGSDTSVFSILLLWLQFVFGRVFFQFSFFGCEFGIRVFTLSNMSKVEFVS